MSAMVCLLRLDRWTRCYADGTAVCWQHLSSARGRSKCSKTVDRPSDTPWLAGSADGTWRRSTVHQAATTARQRRPPRSHMVDRLIDVRCREDLCRMPTQCRSVVDAGMGWLSCGVKGGVRGAA